MNRQAHTMDVKSEADLESVYLCSVGDLIPNSGVAVLLKSHQLAIFYLPDSEPSVFALDNFDPKAQAHVLSRGILGDWQGHRVVASPIYKQHYCLVDGVCLEDESLSVNSYPVSLRDGSVYLAGQYLEELE